MRRLGDYHAPVTTYRPRLISRALSEDLATFPVAVLTGARQVGKSTLTRESDAWMAGHR